MRRRPVELRHRGPLLGDVARALCLVIRESLQAGAALLVVVERDEVTCSRNEAGEACVGGKRHVTMS